MCDDFKEKSDGEVLKWSLFPCVDFGYIGYAVLGMRGQIFVTLSSSHVCV